MKKIIKIILAGLVFFSVAQLKAQENDINSILIPDTISFKIGLVARADIDSVVLVWVPNNLKILKFGLEKGYFIERAVLNSNGTFGKFEKLTKEPVMKWSIDKWKIYIEDGNPQKNIYEKMVYPVITDDFKQYQNNKEFEGLDDLQKIMKQRTSDSWGMFFIAFSLGMSPIASEGLGLRFIDKSVKAGESYVYRVFINGTFPGYNLDTSYANLKIDKFEPSIYKRTINALPGDEVIITNWSLNKETFAYHVERSEDDGKTFVRINKTPIMVNNITKSDSIVAGFKDTNVINYRKYIYRVYGITHFAEVIYLGEVAAMGRDFTPPNIPVLDMPKHINSKQVKLTWKMPEPVDDDLLGFYIGRDTSSQGPFQLVNKTILPKETREFYDESFIPGERNFYIILAVDTANNGSYSQPRYVALIDSTPPAPPNWLKGTMDSNGVVTLILNKAKEKDFMGFRILKANDPSHEFISLIEGFGNDTIDFSNDTIFVDTVSVETTTKYVYYTATALDLNYNESVLSEIISIPRPDRIPPASPIITDIYVTDSTVNIQYAPSFSKDVNYHIIYRWEDGKENADSISFSGSKDSIYIDRSIAEGKKYKYFMVAVDSANLRSEPCIPLVVKTLINLKRPPVTNVNVEYSNEQKCAILKWDYINLNENFVFVIYRNYEDEGLKRYTTVQDNKQRMFLDKSVSKSRKYIYAIKVFTKSNAESPMSETAEINIK